MGNVTSLLLGIVSSVIGAYLFKKLAQMLDTWNPSEDRILDLVREFDANQAYKKIEFHFQISMFLLVWLFLGNFFWILSEFAGSFVAVGLQALVEILGGGISLSIISFAVVVGVKFMSVLSFFVGIRLLIRVYRQRDVAAKFKERAE